MKATIEQLSTANKTNVEALATIANTAFASAERLAALNLNTARNLLEETVDQAKAFMNAKDPRELVALQTAFAQPALEKAIAYSRSIYEIASETREALGKIFEGQAAVVSTNMSGALDQIAKKAPAGSDVAIAAVKSAIAASNSAYEQMTKVAKQVTDIAEANVAAATNATIKAATKKAA
jgi:phasin family protein